MPIPTLRDEVLPARAWSDLDMFTASKRKSYGHLLILQPQTVYNWNQMYDADIPIETWRSKKGEHNWSQSIILKWEYKVTASGGHFISEFKTQRIL